MQDSSCFSNQALTWYGFLHLLHFMTTFPSSQLQSSSHMIAGQFDSRSFRSMHGQIVPSQIVPINSHIVPQNSQFVPPKSQFVPHMLCLFSKWVNVIRVQSSDRNMDDSIFRTIYIIVRASYVNFTMHCRTI